MRLSVLCILLLINFCLYGQENEQGYYKVSKAQKDKALDKSKSKLHIQFIGPTGKPVTSRIKFSMNTDSVVPVIDETGMYTTTVKPGKYTFTFIAPWWYEVKTDSLFLKPQTSTTISVHFEAMEYRLDD